MTWKKAAHYTKEQLDAFYLADLLVDYRCAVRDGMMDYAAKVRLQVEHRLPMGVTFEQAEKAKVKG